MSWRHAHEKDPLSVSVEVGFKPICPCFQCQFVCSGDIIFFDIVRRSISEKSKSPKKALMYSDSKKLVFDS